MACGADVARKGFYQVYAHVPDVCEVDQVEPSCLATDYGSPEGPGYWECATHGAQPVRPDSPLGPLTLPAAPPGPGRRRPALR
ncbi:hypothetical protein ACIRG5_45810 [Lentzea sp. NPDC102401]|uniref:hypothetical protein n=1 Tax=Lentzea sp. NPDC102401 TaxID=3364128 RepID=UPI00382E0956